MLKCSGQVNAPNSARTPLPANSPGSQSVVDTAGWIRDHGDFARPVDFRGPGVNRAAAVSRPAERLLDVVDADVNVPSRTGGPAQLPRPQPVDRGRGDTVDHRHRIGPDAHFTHLLVNEVPPE